MDFGLVLAPLLNSYVTLAKSFDLPDPQFFDL